MTQRSPSRCVVTIAVRSSPVFAPFEVRIASGLPAIGPLDGRPPCARMSAIRLRVQVSGSQAAIGRPPAACVVNDCPSNDATDRGTMPAGEPSGAELGRRDRDVGEHAVTLEGQVDLPTDEIAHEGSLEIADTGDRATIERDDDVA